MSMPVFLGVQKWTLLIGLCVSSPSFVAITAIAEFQPGTYSLRIKINVFL
jgi:hypothetical protein